MSFIPEEKKSGYPSPYADFSMQVPEYYNFGFDVIDRWAKKDPARPALLWVNQDGEEKRFTFADLKTESDLALKILQDRGIRKGDRVLILLPRIPAWWFFIIALIKLGAVYSPAPTMLTSKDISYRLITGKFALIITDSENAPKVSLALDESRAGSELHGR